MTPDTVDVLVLGGGPAGLVAAIRAGDLGARTALVTRDAFGGEHSAGPPEHGLRQRHAGQADEYLTSLQMEHIPLHRMFAPGWATDLFKPDAGLCAIGRIWRVRPRGGLDRPAHFG